MTTESEAEKQATSAAKRLTDYAACAG